MGRGAPVVRPMLVGASSLAGCVLFEPYHPTCTEDLLVLNEHDGPFALTAECAERATASDACAPWLATRLTYLDWPEGTHTESNAMLPVVGGASLWEDCGTYPCADVVLPSPRWHQCRGDDDVLAELWLEDATGEPLDPAVFPPLAWEIIDGTTTGILHEELWNGYRLDVGFMSNFARSVPP